MSIRKKIYCLYLIIVVNLVISLGLAFLAYSMVVEQEVMKDRLDNYYVLIAELYREKP